MTSLSEARDKNEPAVKPDTGLDSEQDGTFCRRLRSTLQPDRRPGPPRQ